MKRWLSLLSLLLTGHLASQDPGGALRAWLKDFQSGSVRFQKDGLTDPAMVEDADKLLAAVAAQLSPSASTAPSTPSATARQRSSRSALSCFFSGLSKAEVAASE